MGIITLYQWLVADAGGKPLNLRERHMGSAETLLGWKSEYAI